MAILSSYPGLEVTVAVDGQRAQEYDAPADEVEARAREIDFSSIPQVPIQGSEAPYTIKYIESKRLLYSKSRWHKTSGRVQMYPRRELY